MTANIALDKMSTEEKLEAMELIWNDLCRSAKDIPSPEWHGDILDQRRHDIEAGADRFIDWADAKRLITKKLSEN